MSRVPAEWEPHESVWLAWPSDEALWGDDLREAQLEFVALCRAIARPGGGARGERLDVLVRTERDMANASGALSDLGAHLHRAAYGDIWLRDTAPIFSNSASGLGALRFAFNGWGGKYLFEADLEVASFVAHAAGVSLATSPLVAEGGAFEFDGEGTLLTTRLCLLNANRNPGHDEVSVEHHLREAFSLETVLWLDGALENDHTDGHIDTLVRFVRPGEVVCMSPAGPDDPNAEVLQRIATDVSTMQDAAGRIFVVHQIPSPGRVLDREGEVMPASYVNFYIANRSVVVPTYGVAQDAQALAALERVFPNRIVMGVPARAILTGGGAFHCITQQQPRVS